MVNILIVESVDLNTLETLADEHGAMIEFQDEKIPDSSESEQEITFYYKPDISVEQIELESHYYDAILTRPKHISQKAIENSKHLKLIIRGGSGVNSIALNAAKAKNVVVENTPGLNSTATAEYTFNLIFSLLARRNIFLSAYDVREGKVSDPLNYAGVELEGKSIAILGLGNIGQRMVARCQAFGMEVYAYNRSKKESVACFQSDNMEEVLAKQPDLVSLHLPLVEETQHILDEKTFSWMKEGTILLNTARPQLVEVEAFRKALNSGKISCAGIDGDMDVILPFVKADPDERCIITHHIADATYEAQQKITKQMLTQAIAFFNEGEEINRVV